MNRQSNFPSCVGRRAFSLIELLIVILIISLVIGILLPVLGSVRNSGREAATRNLLTNVNQATLSFQTDQQGRMPGYFSARDMGATANNETGAGFSAMENVLLDLSGGLRPASSTGAVEVGPGNTAALKTWFDPDQVGIVDGLNPKAYFTPPPQYYKKLDGTDNAGTKTVGLAGNLKVRDLVDAWNTPILAWTTDSIANGPVAAITDFARATSTAASPARFYLNSNSVFLASTNNGALNVDERNKSVIGYANTGDAAISLGGVLGSPGSPVDTNVNVPNILPSAPRGSFVLHSAGKNGIYVGREERGGSFANNGPLYYGLNYKSLVGDIPLTDGDGKPTSRDIMKDFDDLISSGS